MLVDGSCKHVGGLSKEPNYNSLSTFVGRLKKAAIDAYMRSLGFNLVDGYYALQVHMDSDYGVPDSQKYQYIVPPDEAGSNGGENRNVYAHSRFVDEFENIRKFIDSKLEMWFGLPDPYGFDECISAYKDAIGKICSDDNGAVDTDGNGASIGGGQLEILDGVSPGVIGINLQGLVHSASSMKGKAMNAFRSQFALTLPRVLKNLYLTMNVHYSTLAAERAVIEESRKKITRLVVDTTVAFNAVAQNRGVSSNFFWDIAGVALEVAMLPFGGGAVSLALAGASASLSLLGAFKSETEKQHELGSQTYEGVRDNFGAIVDALASEVRDCERAIDDNLTHNVGVIQGDVCDAGQSQEGGRCETYDTVRFHLLPASIHNIEEDENVDVDENEVGLMTTESRDGGYMPKIYSEVVESANKLNGVTMSTPARRASGDFGIGEVGPGGAFDRLKQVIHELLLDLSWRVEMGIVNLRAAVNDIAQQDEESARQLESIAALVDEGSGVNPWDQESQGSADLKAPPEDIDSDTLSGIESLMKPS